MEENFNAVEDNNEEEPRQEPKKTPDITELGRKEEETLENSTNKVKSEISQKQPDVTISEDNNDKEEKEERKTEETTVPAPDDLDDLPSENLEEQPERELEEEGLKELTEGMVEGEGEIKEGEEEKEEEEEEIEIDISVDDVSEDLLSDRAAGLLVAEDEAEEEILFKEEEWIPPLTRWTKLRRYFAKFSLLRGALIIVLLLMSSFTMITYATGQSINDKLNQGLQELNLGLERLQSHDFITARTHFTSAEAHFSTARTQIDVYRFSLLLNLPVTVSSFILAPEIIQGANNLPTITDGLIGLSRAYSGLSASMNVLEKQQTNPYSILTSTQDTVTLKGNINQSRVLLADLLNFIFLAEQQKEKFLKQLETNIGEFFSGHLKEFYQTYSLIARELDDLLSMYRIGFEVTMTLLEELSLALEIINHVQHQDWLLAKGLIPELKNLNDKNLVELGRLKSEVTDIDDSWFEVPMRNTLLAVSTWLDEISTTIDEQTPNAQDLISESLINQVLLELKPIADTFIQASQ